MPMMDLNIGSGVIMPPEIPAMSWGAAPQHPEVLVPTMQQKKIVKKSILPPLDPFSFKTGTIADDDLFEFSTENNLQQT